MIGMTDIIDGQLPGTEMRHGGDPAASGHGGLDFLHIGVDHAFTDALATDRCQQNRIDKYFGKVMVKLAFDFPALSLALLREGMGQVGTHDLPAVTHKPV